MILNAAQKCFIKYGYHGVTVRQIAKAGNISLGNLYNYFPDKKTIFDELFERLTKEFREADSPMSRYVAKCDFPNDLPDMAQAIGDNVVQFSSFFKMVYIDAVEFGGKNSSKTFSNTREIFEKRLGEHFSKVGKVGKKGDVDPGFAFIVVYLQFYYLYLLKYIFKAKDVYGKLDEKEIVRLHTVIFENAFRRDSEKSPG